MKKTLLMAAALMIAVGSASATQNHTCQGGHNCNTTPAPAPSPAPSTNTNTNTATNTANGGNASATGGNASAVGTGGSVIGGNGAGGVGGNATGGTANTTGGTAFGGISTTTSGPATTNSGNINNTSQGGAGGSATSSAGAGNVGNVSGIGNTVKSLSPEANANSTNVNTALGGSATQGQQQGQQQGQGQVQGIIGSGNSTTSVKVNTEGTVKNSGNSSSSSGVKNSGNSNNTNVNVAKGGAGGAGGSATIAEGAVSNTNTINTGGNSQSVTTTGTVGNVSSTGGSVGNITINTAPSDEQAANRDLTDVQVAGINAAATVEAAKLQADAIRHASEQKIRNTPSVNGPALTSSNDTCMGSTSGSINLPGLGIGGGSSWVDSNCKMLKNSRELWNMGMKAAAMALMCNDADNREALELTGYECPQTTAKKAKSEKAAAANEQYTDPIVRQRLGLAALK